MEVRCDKCQARYKVDDARIGPQGLTMRCGKCQNTFKVTRQPGAAPAAAKPAAPKPAAPPADEGAGRTMMFQTGNLKPAAPPAKPAAPPPTPAAAKPAPRPSENAAGATMVFGQSPIAPAKPAPKAAASDDAAGATMMFGQSPVAPQKPAAPKAPPAKTPASDDAAGATMMFGQSPVAPQKAAPAAKPAPARPPVSGDAAGSTMMFGQSPVAPPQRAAAKPAAAKPASADDAAGATMMFGQSPVAPASPAAADDDAAGSTMMFGQSPAGHPPAADPEPAHDEPAENPDEAAAAEPAHASAPAYDEDQPFAADDGEPQRDDGSVHAEDAEPTPHDEPAAAGRFDKAPPRGLLIGVGAAVAALLLLLVAAVIVKKTGKHRPAPAALEALQQAQTAAELDTVQALQDAEGRVKDAVDVAGPKADFPEAQALLARIEVQWADALNDQAALLTARGQADSEAKAADATEKAKAHLKAALDTASQALKADPKSPDLELALADYYRAQHAGSNLSRELRKAQALQADDAQVKQIQALAAAGEEDGAEKAVPQLKAALAQAPRSARLHFHLALAYAQLKSEADALKEARETLRLSPKHDRANLLTEQLAGASAAEQK